MTTPKRNAPAPQGEIVISGVDGASGEGGQGSSSANTTPTETHALFQGLHDPARTGEQGEREPDNEDG